MGDGTGSDMGKMIVQNLHLTPLLVLPVLASGRGSHPPNRERISGTLEEGATRSVARFGRSD